MRKDFGAKISQNLVESGVKISLFLKRLLLKFGALLLRSPKLVIHDRLVN